jgi:hypothetical protein
MKKLFTSMKFQLAAVSMLLLASCAQTIDPRYAMTADEMKTMKDVQLSETADGAMKGAAIGAAGGALTALVTGGDRDAIIKGAAIGAVVGGTAGGAQGFKKGDAQGKSMVTDKRQRQTIEAGIQKKIKNLNSMINVVNANIIRLKEAQAAGVSPAQIQAEAKKVNDVLTKRIQDNEQAPIEKGQKGSSAHLQAIKKVNAAQKQLQDLTNNNKKQEV